MPHADHLSPETQRPLLLCFSHLRWNFVYQRPQHLLTRAVASYDVVYWEEPIWGDTGTAPRIEYAPAQEGITIVTPVLPAGMDDAASDKAQRALLNELIAERRTPSIAWFYTPMAFAFADHCRARVTIYDCMDELTMFAGASPRLALLERRLMRQADIVFAGGRSLYRAKRSLHNNIHCFPSAVDRAHFAQARAMRDDEPEDLRDIPHPRIAFFGVLDERMDRELVCAIADRRPDWQLVLIGPVAKITEADIPHRPNITWLHQKPYAALPAYLAAMDAGFMPFMLNEATRFISPTKTPEFLAAGLPVVSTPVADVVAHWGALDVVRIAGSAGTMVTALEAAMAGDRNEWLARVDVALASVSWDSTWSEMTVLIDTAFEQPTLQKVATAPRVS